MAIVQKFGTYTTSQSHGRDAPPGEPSLQHYNVPPRVIRDRASLESGNSVGSTILLALVSTSAVLSMLGQVVNEAAGTGVTVDIGFADDAALGVTAKTDILVDGQAIATAGSFSLTKDVSVADTFKPVWQLLGLASDPKGQVQLIATIGGADLGAAAAIAWETDFTTY